MGPAFVGAMADEDQSNVDSASLEHHREAIASAFHKFDINGDGKISEDWRGMALKRRVLDENPGAFVKSCPCWLDSFSC